LESLKKIVYIISIYPDLNSPIEKIKNMLNETVTITQENLSEEQEEQQLDNELIELKEFTYYTTKATTTEAVEQLKVHCYKVFSKFFRIN